MARIPVCGAAPCLTHAGPPLSRCAFPVPPPPLTWAHRRYALHTTRASPWSSAYYTLGHTAFAPTFTTLSLHLRLLSSILFTSLFTGTACLTIAFWVAPWGSISISLSLLHTRTVGTGGYRYCITSVGLGCAHASLSAYYTTTPHLILSLATVTIPLVHCRHHFCTGVPLFLGHTCSLDPLMAHTLAFTSAHTFLLILPAMATCDYTCLNSTSQTGVPEPGHLHTHTDFVSHRTHTLSLSHTSLSPTHGSHTHSPSSLSLYSGRHFTHTTGIPSIYTGDLNLHHRRLLSLLQCLISTLGVGYHVFTHTCLSRCTTPFHFHYVSLHTTHAPHTFTSRTVSSLPSFTRSLGV